MNIDAVSDTTSKYWLVLSRCVQHGGVREKKRPQYSRHNFDKFCHSFFLIFGMNHPNTSKSSPTLQYRYVEMTSDMTSSVILDRILSYFFQRRYAITSFQMTSRLHSGRAPSCPEIPENPEMSQMSWNCPEISNCPEILYIWSECPDMDLNLQIWCHQVASFKAKIHQIRFRLGLCPRPRWGSLQRSPMLSPRWIWIVEYELNLLIYAYRTAGLL